jgi:membrane-bound metal-dependent hydrolase YbcI (DUF457 family)
MDLFTHGISGALLGAASTKRKDIFFVVIGVGVFASVLIDISDAWLYIVDIELYRKYHRLYTHSIFAAPFMAAISACPFWLYIRKNGTLIYLVSIISIFVHLAMDLFCDWELRLLYPLSDHDFALYLVEYSSRPTLAAVTVLFMIIVIIRDRQQKKAALEGIAEETSEEN